MNVYRHLLVLCLVIFGSDAYRILAVFPFNSRSHNNMFEGVAKGLAKGGHQVDVVTHFEMKNPPKNYKIIINLGGTRKSLVNNFSIQFAALLEGNTVELISKLYGNELCELLALEEMQNLIKNPPSDPPYDILITEAFTANCFVGLGYALKVPVITVSSTLEFSWLDAGNLDSAAFAPNVLMHKAEICSFWDRLQNTIMIHRSKYEYYIYTGEVQTEAMRKYLSPGIPHVREVERNVALTFVNSYHSLHGIRIRSPSLIDIAGIHLEHGHTEMSQDLQNWMDESKDGVVYFTLGSMVIIETLPKETLLTIYASFSKIKPVRVLMKIVNTENLPPGLPSNVIVSKWIPQIIVLKHNNTRLFMTHGGLISTQEALYHGVPLIGFPLFGDQQHNIQLFVKKNMALSLDYRSLTEKSLDDALNAVLTNPLYRESANYESRLFRDRPMSATKTVNFWVEYVIRNGPDALKSPAVDMYWWEIALLDVYSFILLSFFLIIYFAILITKYACCVFVRTSGNLEVEKQKDE
ncbi:UDP-glucuronosyltransferase 2B20-like [Belonocnema kinseyi]|uniref:UDP-glucuronosyltransferase 2B20-like n=1 Tax=Belonocnema kinseyi TaxID=2817044 RepID=UPI00143CED94|nr:UDP-glucuronosyltransferase 2B20-like [Belonocnema kinseyi]